MSYTQLTLAERYQISMRTQRGQSQKAIARVLGRDPGTISRELRRNRHLDSYCPECAHAISAQRRSQAPKGSKLTTPIVAQIESKLREDWSPEQIAHWLRHEMKTPISHQTIYTHIKRDRKAGGKLYRHLRQGHKKYRRPYGTSGQKPKIPGRVGIDQRPAVVEKKQRIGDWEVDTMYGSGSRGALVTAAERRTRFTVARQVQRCTSSQVTAALVDMLMPYRDRVFTLTGDNGSEFAEHKKIAEQLEAQFYFADPYSPWQRGLNENTNGLLRQYFPKWRSLRKVEQTEVQSAQNRLNSRPRKSLGYKSPAELFIGAENLDSSYL